jgi:hypothetical protein
MCKLIMYLFNFTTGKNHVQCSRVAAVARAGAGTFLKTEVDAGVKTIFLVTQLCQIPLLLSTLVESKASVWTLQGLTAEEVSGAVKADCFLHWPDHSPPPVQPKVSL